LANVTPTTAAVMIAEEWTKELEKPYYNELHFLDSVKRRDSLLSGGGDVLHIPFLSTYNARDKVPGTAVTYDANTETEITLTVNKHKYLAFILEDIVKVQSNYDLASAYRGAQKEALARAADADLAGLHASAGTNIAAGAVIDDADMIAAALALDLANVPMSNRTGIVNSYAVSDLRNVNKYTTYDQTGEKGVATSANPMIARVYGFDLLPSNNIVTTGSGTFTDHNLFFHRDAISFAQQLKPTYKAEDSVDYIGLKMVLHSIYGFAVERPTGLVDVERTR
jgi:hypothetical protein